METPNIMNLPPYHQSIANKRWPAEQAWEWHNARPWLAGCNFQPSTAVNQLEMWQAETFDEAALDQELGWLAGLGMNTMRVFLHDLLWMQDSQGFLSRIDRFLGIAAKHGISPLLVFFDSCWHPFPRLGKQREPEPGVHNSFWVQSPGREILARPGAFATLKEYVTGVVSHFRDDPRVLGWDVWNEPDNESPWYMPRELGDAKPEIVFPLIATAFDWVRSAQPTQPVTSGVWRFDAGGLCRDYPIARFMLEASDVLSFHIYLSAGTARDVVAHLLSYDRPLWCTEYLARTIGNTLEDNLPLFHRHKIAAFNWGGVTGKTQTLFPWNSWQEPILANPEIWFHDLLRSDGTPFRESEAILFRSLTGRS